MAWNWMMVEFTQGGRAETMIGEEIGLTREQAHAEVQRTLDAVPQLAPIAAQWRVGAKDDTVYAEPLVWAIYEYPDGEDPRRAAVAWLQDFANLMGSFGSQKITVEQLPEE